MTQQAHQVTLGVDTHVDTHVGAVIDNQGRILGTLSVETTQRGYEQLLEWTRGHGELTRAGVEGTGAYGAGLARFLTIAGVDVIEVNRPNRQRRRKNGKSDPADAEAAARATLAGEADVVPKAHDGVVESIRVLRIARSSAVKARTQAANQIKDLVLTAPDDLRTKLRRLSTEKRVDVCARSRPSGDGDPGAATRRALRHLSVRHQTLASELRELDTDLARLISHAAPRLLAQPGIGPESAAKLLVAAGDNYDRLRSDAALAALCGASPVEASSGRVVRHRLNRGGDRQANNALWTVVKNRMRYDTETKVYVARRRAEGMSDKEIIRCLKRHLVRRLYPLLLADLHEANSSRRLT